MPDEAVIQLSVEKENKLQIKSGRSRFTLQTLKADEFPRLEAAEWDINFSVEQKNLKDLISKTGFAMAQQDVRYYLNGLLLLIENNSLKVVATNGHRLGYAVLNLEKEEIKREIILPRKTVLELEKQLNDNKDPVTIEIFKNKVRFTFTDIILISKIIEGKFPDYNRVIPTSNTKQIELNRLVLLKTLQRASILSNINEKFRDVRLIISTGLLQIICKNNEQEQAIEEIEIKYEDEEKIDINFNITYLLDLLNNLTCETILCAFKDSHSSILITMPGNNDFKYIVMPMKT
jgi:DNA polymerase-3 subunit beta